MIVEIASFLFLRERNVVSLKVSLITGGDFHMKWIQMPLGPLQTNAYILMNDQKSALSLTRS